MGAEYKSSEQGSSLPITYKALKSKKKKNKPNIF